MDGLVKRIERLEAIVLRPCIFEARPFNGPSVYASALPSTIMGAWCQTHQSWNCLGTTTSDTPPAKIEPASNGFQSETDHGG